MNLSALLNPKSIAIVGASKNLDKPGAQILQNLIKSEYDGKIYPVNNRESGLIQGLQTFPTILDIPHTVDLVIVAIPSIKVEAIVDQSVSKKIKTMIIISAGLKESTKEGILREKRIAQKCSEADIALLGPNCLGLINPSKKLNASFANISKYDTSTSSRKNSNITLISQSGAFGTAAFDWANAHNVGFSLFVSLGNKAIISENDFLDPLLLTNTKVVALYLEDFTNGYLFMQRAQELTKHKPIILIKPGKSTRAQNAMKSHTGSLATDDEIVTTACEKAGIIRAFSSEEMFHLMYIFNTYNQITGNNIAIITNAGGPGILATDHLEENNLQLAPISPHGKKELARLLPRQANIHDPIDILGDAKAERYHHALKICIHEPKVDALLVILTPQTTTEIEKTAHSISQLKHITDKPIICSFLGGTLVKEGKDILNKHNIPNFTYPEQAIYALGKLYEYATIKELANIKIPINQAALPSKTKYQSIIHNAKQEKRILYPEEAFKLLSDTDISHPTYAYVKDKNELEIATAKVSTPLVMKLISKEVIHKTEMKAVYTNLNDINDIEDAFDNLTTLHNNKGISDARIIVQEQIQDGVECFLGIKRDPTFGPVVVFGSGGIYAQVYKDIQQAIAPLTIKESIILIKGTNIYQILSGIRSNIIYDIDLLSRIICQIAHIAINVPEISEIDLNPLIATQNQIYTVDPRIVLT